MKDLRMRGDDVINRARAHTAPLAPSERRRAPGIARRTILLGLAIASLAAPALAGEPKISTDPTHWQSRYRELVKEAERLREKVELERELYADANRRNYRRGNKRHVHRKAGEEAAAKLAKVEAKLATIEDDARRAGVPRGWLNKIQIELEDEAERPSVAAGPGDEGRNPLYLESENDETPSDASDASDADAAERSAGRNPLHLEPEREPRSRTGP